MEKEIVYFGLYRMGTESLEPEFSQGYLNVHIVWMTPDHMDTPVAEIHTVKRYGGKVWLSAGGIIHYSKPVSLYENWQAALNSMMNRLEEEGVMDCVLGFYFDEPMLNGIRKEDYRTLTQYMRETWPTLRVMSIFAVNAIDPDIWSVGEDQVLDPETLQYTTDAGYDMYHDIRGEGILPYQSLNATLKQRFGRDDFRVWHVPCIMNFWGNKDESYALAHTEAMYNFLKQEKNPGGMMCYAFSIPNHDGDLGNIGLDEMCDRAENPWTTLYKRVQEIGREIIGK